MLLAAACAGIGCAALDVEQPITLLPDDDWSPERRRIVAEAAQCWNDQFGTKMRVGRSGETLQEVRVFYNDLICAYGAAGRTETTQPVRVSVCPPAYYALFGERFYPAYIFGVMLHELGHVLNIRYHASDPNAVMASGEIARDRYAPPRFTAADRASFDDVNPGVQLTPRCEVDTFEDSNPPRCRCRP